jgi:dephospho-CoA kinase
MKLGVTGGIGSGKTSVCRVFEILGIPVFSADQEARKIMDTDPVIGEMVENAAGSSVYENGILKREALAKLIFNNSEILAKINSIIHPVVFQKFIEWATLQNSPYVILEAAILFESGASSLVDKTLTVIAPAEERIARVMRRNMLTREQVLERIRNQSPDDDKMRQSDFVVNNSERDMIIPGILKIHNLLLKEVKGEA